MRRREFIALIGAAATWPLLWPRAARAQQAAMPVIGFLHAGVPDRYAFVLAGFRQGLKEAGYVEGQNIAVEYRWANNELDRLPELAADLVRRRVALIVAGGSPAPALAAKAATSTIPIVGAFGGDPVRSGLVASLNRPGGNITGVSLNSAELPGKVLGLLREMVPQATTIAYLIAAPAEERKSAVLALAPALGRQVIVLEARSDRDFEAAFATLVVRRAGALAVQLSPLFTSNRDKLLALAARHKIPTIWGDRAYTLDGGLMSYGASTADIFRQTGVFIGRILKGEKPADLPFQLPTRYELVINLKTARALGIDVPPTLIALADEVIE